MFLYVCSSRLSKHSSGHNHNFHTLNPLAHSLPVCNVLPVCRYLQTETEYTRDHALPKPVYRLQQQSIRRLAFVPPYSVFLSITRRCVLHLVFFQAFFVNMYHNRPFYSHISVHYATSLHCVECAKQVLFDYATSIRFVE